MSSEPAYRLDALEVRHHARIVLTIPFLEVPVGEVLCLIGPPGAGKSTLLRLLAGLDSPSVGAVSLFGEPFHANSPASLKRLVTLVFQQPLLLAGTVRSNVEYGLKIRGVKDRTATAMTMLERLHLAHLAERRASAVSGGEAQLIALARALVLTPKVLLLDEPTNNLDPARVALVEQVVLEEQQHHGTTVIWATHNHFQARRVGDRVALMLDGQLVEVAAAEDLFDNPRDPRTAAFLHGAMVY